MRAVSGFLVILVLLLAACGDEKLTTLDEAVAAIDKHTLSRTIVMPGLDFFDAVDGESYRIVGTTTDITILIYESSDLVRDGTISGLQIVFRGDVRAEGNVAVGFAHADNEQIDALMADLRDGLPDQ